jgi:hypothetical protein
MDFQKVTIDTDVDELEGDEARELVSDFQNAQEQNIDEFKTASEKLEGLDESAITEFEDAQEELTQDVADVTFMSEDEAAQLSFSRKREILADFSEEEEAEAGDDVENDGEEAEFSNMGQRGETHNEDEAKESVAKEYLGDIQGLEI